jgi:PKD repeat protein
MLTVAAAILLLLLTTNFTITNAQEQAQQTSQQPAGTQNETSLFQSTEDSFKVRVPDGWVIQDMDNTGFGLLTEVFQGYGVLAQLCLEEQEQAAPGTSSSCQSSRGDIIHIIRYPNLGGRLGFTAQQIIANTNATLDNILAYEIQKLHEVGYRDIQILNSTYRTVNADISKVAAAMNDDNTTALPPTAKVPAKLVEMTYRTDSAPNEIRTGHFMLTATNVTPRNLGMITGYSIFYEGNSAAATTAAAEEEEEETITPLPPAVSQVFDSFELIAGEEAAQDILAALAAQAEQAEQQVGQQAEQQEQPTNTLRGELTSSATEGVAPATFEFEANIEGGTEPYTINWDFDDGTEESDGGETVMHTFDEAGTYTVTATVIDSAGQTAAASIEITVEEPSPAQEAEEPITPPAPQDSNNEPDLDGSENNTPGSDNDPAALLDLLDSDSGSRNIPRLP